MSGYALVTGGAKRVGAVIVRRLVADGWPVAIHANTSRSAAEALAAQINQSGGRATVTAGDLSDLERLPTLFCAPGHCALLVNSASQFSYDGFGAMDAALARRMLDINLLAPMFLAQAFLAQLPAGEAGCVINLTDQKVHNPNPDFFSYTLSKIALDHATATLAQALAPRARAVAIAPGLMLHSGEQTDENFQAMHQQTALGRGSSPEDIAEAVAFVARARAMTGVTLLVDGGQHLVPSTRDVMFLGPGAIDPDAAKG
jgi:NAD(P)-dependent dehydrogenase (short-subunit alcohol dehydrogenase family)